MNGRCPYCGEQFERRGLDGHLRLAHPQAPRKDELLRLLRLTNVAGEAAERLGKIEMESDDHVEAQIKCSNVEARARGDLADLLDDIGAEV